MTNRSLATSYLLKARKRLLVLELLQREEAYSDVVREAQELVELALKAMLRQAGIEPPKWHDVSGTVRDYHSRFPTLTGEELERLIAASIWLRKERESSLYGDIDFIPTEQYGPDAGVRAIDDATFVLQVATRILGTP
ncbi:MAG: HEPN domain-containing protein [Vicinamibacterales bacterium]